MSGAGGAAIGALAALGFALAARAEVLDAQSNGFTVRNTATIAASPARVWRTLTKPASWWDSAHTYSGRAASLQLEARAGGAWRETWPGGAVLHLTVVNMQPDRLLRLEGALGPLQAMGVAGHLTWTLKAQGEATIVTETYDIGGHGPGGLDKLASPVDQVLSAQLERLKRQVETGRAR